jgi:ParB family chromosome partitioning protein
MDKPNADTLPLNYLEPNPLQPRGSINPDSLAELVDSIKQHGILEPLVVAKTPAGFQIIAGERRWRAAKIAGLKEIPVIIKETTPQGMLEMAIIENIQRFDLNPIERGKAFERLMREFNLSTTEIAERLSKSSSYISNSLRLLTLPDALKDGLLTGVITEGHARALAAIEDTRTMIEAYKIVLKESASVRRAEELARRFKHKNKQQFPAKTDLSKTLIVSDVLDRMQQDIERSLGTSSRVKLKQSLRETKIIIALKGAPTSTTAMLDRIYTAIKSSKN